MHLIMTVTFKIWIISLVRKLNLPLTQVDTDYGDDMYTSDSEAEVVVKFLETPTSTSTPSTAPKPQKLQVSPKSHFGYFWIFFDNLILCLIWWFICVISMIIIAYTILPQENIEFYRLVWKKRQRIKVYLVSVADLIIYHHNTALINHNYQYSETVHTMDWIQLLSDSIYRNEFRNCATVLCHQICIFVVTWY